MQQIKELIFSFVRITGALLTVAVFTALGFVFYDLLVTVLDRAFGGGGKVGAAIPRTLEWGLYAPLVVMPVLGLIIYVWAFRIVKRRIQEHSNRHPVN